MTALDSATRRLRPHRRRKTRAPVSLVVLGGLLRAGDLIAIYASGLGVQQLYFGADATVNWRNYNLAALLALIFAGTIFQWNGLYRLQGLRVRNLKLDKLAASWLLVLLALIVIAFELKISADYSRFWIAGWYVAALAMMVSMRGALWLTARRWVKQGRLGLNVAIVGGGPHGERLIQALRASGDEGLRIVGVFDDRAQRVPARIAGCTKIGKVRDLPTYARYCRIDEVIVALPWSAEERVAEVLKKLRPLPVDVRLAPDLIGFRLNGATYGHRHGLPLLEVFHKPLSDWRLVAKQVEDFALAGALLLFLAPVFAIVALAIKLDSPGPVFFRQRRYGINNRLIGVYKFRTMHHHLRDVSASRLVTRNDPRVTRVGALLRKTSLDELPQLINVLRGEMSIVGPRPHPLSAKAADHLYEEIVAEYAVRHRVKPGITGWAQVNGWRGETDTVEKIQKRVEHDLYYIENWSLAFDLKILFLTVFALLKSENAY
jgi:Undecaprenyl-phosphate glucose phosphotransferase